MTKKGHPTTEKKPEASSRFVSATLIIIGVALLMLLSFWYLTQAVNGKIIAANVESMKELALHDQSSIRNSITLRWDNMEGVARNLADYTYDRPEELLTVMKDLTLDIPSASKISLLDSEGTNHLSNGVIEKNSYLVPLCAGKTERFVTRLNTRARFSENAQEVLLEGVPVDFSANGIHFDWLLCQFPVDTLEKELKITNYGGAGYSSLIDSDGNYVINVSQSHSFLDHDNFFLDMKEAELDGYRNVEEMFSDEKTDTAVYTLNGVKNIMVVSDMEFEGWKFISTVPLSVFNEQTNSIITLFLMLMGIMAIVLTGTLLLSMRQRRQRTNLRIAEAANRSKTEFLFNMSHDIRTPMNAILGNTDIAIKHRDDPMRVDESLAKIKIAGEHLLNLINDILEMSRIESGKLEISEEPMDIRRLIEGAAQMSQSLAIEKSIDFSTQIGEIRDPYVYSDILHANEVLINLLSNAIKYTPEGGDVIFEAEQLGAARDGKTLYRFTIRDNGIGMSEEFQQHLFEAFSREKTSTVSKQEGAGLGLSIVKKIIDLAGGTITVKSRKDEGSVFTVELPMRVMDEEAIRKYEEANKPLDIQESAFSFDRKKVLLVEDNEMNREIASEILEEAGMIIDTAEDGEFAVQAVKEKGLAYYDFILMDIQMPVMDGYQATKVIRSMPGGDKVTIIALSANAFKEDIDKSLSAGMNAHVAKPIDVKMLFKTMQTLAK